MYKTKNLSFTAIDFETANWHKTSACQLGIAVVNDGVLQHSQSWLIKPEPFFFMPRHVAIHGIDDNKVANAPTFLELWPALQPFIDDRILVAHNMPFDKGVMLSLLQHHQLENRVTDFLCTLYMSRVYHPHLPSYRLPDVYQHLFGGTINHHEAESDAVAAARIALSITAENEIRDFDRMTAALYELPREERRVYQHDPPISKIVKEEGYEQCDELAGQEFCFTGEIEGFARSDAWQFVINHGGRINNSMNAKTTCLVVGGYGGAFSEGYLSNKHKKAMEMQAAGKKIAIISDKEFLEITKDIAGRV